MVTGTPEEASWENTWDLQKLSLDIAGAPEREPEPGSEGSLRKGSQKPRGLPMQGGRPGTALWRPRARPDPAGSGWGGLGQGFSGRKRRRGSSRQRTRSEPGQPGRWLLLPMPGLPGKAAQRQASLSPGHGQARLTVPAVLTHIRPAGPGRGRGGPYSLLDLIRLGRVQRGPWAGPRPPPAPAGHGLCELMGAQGPARVPCGACPSAPCPPERAGHQLFFVPKCRIAGPGQSSCCYTALWPLRPGTGHQDTYPAGGCTVWTRHAQGCVASVCPAHTGVHL